MTIVTCGSCCARPCGPPSITSAAGLRRTPACCSRRSAAAAGRDRVQPLLEPLEERQALLGLVILPVGQRQLHRQQLRRVDAEIEPLQRQEAAHHEAGAGEQHERQRELDDDQRAGPAARAHAAGAACGRLPSGPR